MDGMTLEEYYWMIGAILAAGREHYFADSPVIRVSMPVTPSIHRLAKLTGKKQGIKKIVKDRSSREVRVRSPALLDKIYSDTDNLSSVPVTPGDEFDRLVARGAFEVNGEIWMTLQPETTDVIPHVKQRMSIVVFDWLKDNEWIFDYEIDDRYPSSAHYKTALPRVSVSLEGVDAMVYLDWLYANDYGGSVRCPERHEIYKSLVNILEFTSKGRLENIVAARDSRRESVNARIRAAYEFNKKLFTNVG